MTDVEESKIQSVVQGEPQGWKVSAEAAAGGGLGYTFRARQGLGKEERRWVGSTVFYPGPRIIPTSTLGLHRSTQVWCRQPSLIPSPCTCRPVP